MKPSHMLTIAALFVTLLASFHLADDAIRARPGTVEAGLGNLTVVAILFVWLAGALLLPPRRLGYLILLVGSLFMEVVLYLHLKGPNGVAGKPFFFVWTLLALGVTALFTLVLSARKLWNPQWGEPQ